MGTLYVVATPIGNLEDITLRALETLRTVSVIACEDTRTTKKLLSRHAIETPVIAFHAHSTEGAIEKIVERLSNGEDVAVVSDAGTPAISDPGELLVAAAVSRGITVVPIPGASAVTAVVSASGLPARSVLFLGFLPREDVEVREILGPLRDAPYTLVVYESPRRVHATLADLLRSLGDRRAVVAREVTKKFETFERGRLSELLPRFEGEVLGELAVVVAPADLSEGTGVADTATIRKEIRAMLESGMRVNEVAKAIAVAHGMAKAEAYKLAVETKTGAE
jgi:16S rRNA (cytidine1402-2'-O)-methyltransferase